MANESTRRHFIHRPVVGLRSDSRRLADRTGGLLRLTSPPPSVEIASLPRSEGNTLKHCSVHRLAILSLLFVLSAFFLVSASLSPHVTAAGGRAADGTRRAQLTQLEARLKSARATEF